MEKEAVTSASAITPPRDPHNSSDDTKAEFNSYFIIHSK